MSHIGLMLQLCLLVFSACRNSPTINTWKAKDEIHAVLAGQERDWNSGNIDRYMDGYLRSDSVRFASGGNVTYGWQKTLDRYKKGYPDKAAMGALMFEHVDVKILSETSALVFGTWRLKRSADEPWGLFTLVFNKTMDGWKIMHDHTSLAGK